MVIGEKINSLKQLIMIPHVSSSSAAIAQKSTMALAPWFYHPDQDTTVPPPTTLSRRTAFSYCGNIAKCYSFARGSTDYHFYSSSNTVSFRATALPGFARQGGVPSTSASMGGGSNGPQFGMTVGQALHVRVPAHQLQKFDVSGAFDHQGWVMGWDVSARNNNVIGTSCYIERMYAVLLNPASAQPTIYTSRSAGDDAMMFMYIGPPPLSLPNVGATVAWD